MRIINADIFQEVLSDLQSQYDCFNPDEVVGYEAISKALERFNEMATINPPTGYRPIEDGWEYFGFPEDVSRVVRCWKCINGNPNLANDNEVICKNDRRAHNKLGFCSEGIDRTVEENKETL